MGQQGVRLSEAQRREVIRLAARGVGRREIIDKVGVGDGSIGLILGPFGGVYRPSNWAPLLHRLSLEDRIEIKAGIAAGELFVVIGRRLGRATSTISREVGGEAGRGGYGPVKARIGGRATARRPKPTKFAANPRLCARVMADLQALWSPQQIAGWLVDEFPDDPEMRVSHETIYLSLFVQGRGALRKELTALSAHRTRAAPAAGPHGDERQGQLARHGHHHANGPPRPTTGPCPATGKAT